MGWLVSSLRRLRLERAATVGLVLLVSSTALVFSLAPRALDAVGDEALRDQIGAARSADRNIQLIQHDRIGEGAALPTDDLAALDPVATRGESAEERLPVSVRDLVVERGLTVVSPRYRLFKPPIDTENVRFRIQPGVEDHIQLVEGRPPTAAVRRLDNVGPDSRNNVPVYEVAVSRETALTFRLELGDTVEMSVDFSDPLIGRGGLPEAAAMDIVGIYDVEDGESDYWLNDTVLERPSVRWVGGDLFVLDADVLLAPEAYAVLLEGTAFNHYPLRYVWRLYIDSSRLDSATVAGLLDDLRRAQATYPSANVAFGQDTAMRAGLLRLIERQRSEWLAAVSILTVISIGPAAVAAAALGLVVLLSAQRRRQAMALARSRGASIGQVVGAVTLEGLLLTLPAVAVAAGIAVLLVPAGPNLATIAAAGAVALLGTAVIVAASTPGTGALARGPSRESSLRRLGPRRLVLEAGVVVLAAAGAWLLRERGIRGASSTGELAAADPLVAAVPALAGLAASLVAVRLYPLPVRLLAWVSSLRRDLVPVHAMRRSVHGGSAAPVLVVLLATVAIGAFSTASLVYLERASERVAWQSIGAPYRLNPPGNIFPTGFDAGSLDGVEAAADVFRVSIPVAGNGPRHEFVAVDVDAFEAVVAGTPADPGFPAALRGPGPGAGGPIPVIISRSLTLRPDGVQLGEVFPAKAEDRTLQLQAVEIRDSFPWIEPNFHFVIAAADQIRAAAPGAGLLASSAILRAPESAAAAIRRSAEAALPGATVDDRAAMTAAIRSSPSVEAIRAGIAASAAVAALYAALAVAASLTLAGILRAIEVAHLRTLGLTRREAFALVLVEHGPTIIVAAGVGLAFGLGLFALLRPGLGLDGLVGARVEVPIGLEGTQLAIILATFALILALALTLGAIFQRNATPVAAVRRGFE